MYRTEIDKLTIFELPYLTASDKNYYMVSNSGLLFTTKICMCGSQTVLRQH
jgi:hypothetical protein